MKNQALNSAIVFLLALTFAVMCDAVTTIFALRLEGIEEANPFMPSKSTQGILAFSAFIFIAISLLYIRSIKSLSRLSSADIRFDIKYLYKIILRNSGSLTPKQKLIYLDILFVSELVVAKLIAAFSNMLILAFGSGLIFLTPDDLSFLSENPFLTGTISLAVNFTVYGVLALPAALFLSRFIYAGFMDKEKPQAESIMWKRIRTGTKLMFGTLFLILFGG